MAGSLDDVVGRRNQCRAAKGKHHGVRVQGSQPAVSQVGQIQAEARPNELGGDKYADQHTHDAPKQSGERELPNDFVVVTGLD